MRQGRCTPRRDSPRTILGPMGCRGTQSSCRFHDCFGAFVSLDGGGTPGISLYGAVTTNLLNDFYGEFIERSGIMMLSALGICKRPLGVDPSITI